MKHFLKRFFSLGKNEDYELGIYYYNRHMFQEAIVQFDKVLLKKSSSASIHRNLACFYSSMAHRNLGVMLLATGNATAALKKFKKSLILTPDHIDLNYFIGICANNLGHFREAADAFQKILKIDPSHLPTRIKLAITFFNLKMWDQAEATYRNILKKNPHYADIHYHLGLSLLGRGDIHKAITEFSEALSINPNYTNARIKLGIIQIHLGQLDKAHETFSQLLKNHPHYSDLHYFMGIIHAGRNNIDKAIDAIQTSIEKNPNYKDAMIKLAILKCHRKDFGEALKALKDAGEIAPDDQNLRHAITAIEKIIAKPSQSPQTTLTELDNLLGGGKSLNQTIQEFNKHIDIALKFSEMISLIKSNTHSEADDTFWEMLIPLTQDYIKQHPHYPDLYNTLGTFFKKIRRIDRAELEFQKAVSINPDYVTARINLLNAQNQLGKYADALANGEFLTQKGIIYPDVFCAIAESLIHLGRLNEAREKAEAALTARASYSDAHLLLGRIHEKLGNPGEAVQAYETYLRETQGPIKIEAQNALARLKR